MKYQYLNEPIPQESRQELNDKILYLVDQDLAEQSGISREDIYNAYTGDGGLHGLKRSDFANYHEYAEAKKEIENGQFFTPPALCQFIMEALSPAMDETVADLTSGIANFCNFMPLEANFYGCELDIKSHKVAHYLYPTANLEHRDIRFYQPDMRFDYVVGNPPFNLKWETEDGEIISQMYYCLKAAKLLKSLGIWRLWYRRLSWLTNIWTAQKFPNWQNISLSWVKYPSRRMRSNLLAWIATLPRYSFGRRSWTLPTRENLML